MELLEDRHFHLAGFFFVHVYFGFFVASLARRKGGEAHVACVILHAHGQVCPGNCYVLSWMREVHRDVLDTQTLV